MSAKDMRKQIDDLRLRIDRLAASLPAPNLVEGMRAIGVSIDSILNDMVARIDKLEELTMTEKPEDQPEK